MSQQNTFCVNAKQNKQKVRDRKMHAELISCFSRQAFVLWLINMNFDWKPYGLFSCPLRGAVLIPLEYLEPELNE